MNGFPESYLSGAQNAKAGFGTRKEEADTAMELLSYLQQNVSFEAMNEFQAQCLSTILRPAASTAVECVQR